MGHAIRPSSKTQGFSLIELLVVISVLSILAVGVGLVGARGGASFAQSDQAVFQHQFETVQAQAVQGRQTRGIFMDPRGFRLAKRTADGWDVSDHLRRWQGRVTFAAKGAFAPIGTPDIVMLANGQSSAFNLTFKDRAGPPARCAHDGWTGLICTP